MTELMYELYNNTGNLKSHPRLIDDVLYLESNSDMNMLKVKVIVGSILIQEITEKAPYKVNVTIYGDLDANISLKRSTRDGNSNPSVNSHYCKSLMQYALEELTSKICFALK